MWLEPQDEENKQNNPSAPSTPSIGAGGGTAAQPIGTTSNPSTQTPVQANKPSQNFATVQDYLGANKQQGEQLGQQFTGALDTSLTNEKSAIDTAANQTKNDVTNNTINYNPDLVSKAINKPTEVTGNPVDLGSFLQQWNASYAGPSSFEASNNYTGAANAANEAATKQAETATAGGQQQLLQDQFGVYGQGNKGLDQAILQNSSAYPAVQDQSKQFGMVQDYLGNKAADVNAQATKAAADTAATKQQTQNALTGQLGKFQTSINQKVNDAQATATTAANKYQKDMADGNIDAVKSDLKQAGIPDSQINDIASYLQSFQKDYGTNQDLSQGYSFNPKTQVTAANVASPQDYANAAAYQQLTGVNYGGVLDPANAAQAGTNPSPVSGFDTSSLPTYLKNQLAAQDKAFMTNPVNIGQDLQDMSNPALATQYAQKYVDAAQRQGQMTKDNPQLAALWNQARSAFAQYVNRPDIQQGMVAILKVLNPIFVTPLK